MALTFPRDMVGPYEWEKTRLVLRHQQELGRTGYAVNAKDLGSPVWTCLEFQTKAYPHVIADQIIADFRSLRGAIKTFYVHDVARPRPASISSDSEADLSSVLVSSVSGTNQTLALNGLPASFVMTAGDWVSVETSGGGRELFQLINGATANGSGVTTEMDVTPLVPSTVSADNAVTLIKAPVEMRLEPDTLDDPYVSATHRRVTFKAVQETPSA